MFNSHNPIFARLGREEVYTEASTATFTGTLLKTLILFLLAVGCGLIAAILLNSQSADNQAFVFGVLGVSGIITFISALIGIFNPGAAKVCSIVYSAFEGFTLGAITAVLELYFPGIGFTTIATTAIIFFVTLGLYSIKVIRVTSNLIRFLSIFFIGLIFASILSLVLNMNNMITADMLPVILIINVVILIIGSLTLAVDFERAKQLEEMGVDKKLEWQVSLGLMITLVWIYVQVLRIFLIIASKKD